MHRTYLIQLAAALMLALAVCAGTLWTIDPYDLYTYSPQQRGETDADLFWHLRLHKPYAMRRVKAEQLIVGSSRSARLSPSHLADSGTSAYNASLPGISLRELRRMVEHAHTIRPLDRVVVGLDYTMFRPGYRNELFVDDRLLKVNPTLLDKGRHVFQQLIDRWSSLVSVDALIDAQAAVTVAGGSQRRFFADGTWEAKVPAHRVGNPVYSMLARQKYREFSDGGEDVELSEFEALLDFAAAHDIELVLLISPLHAIALNTIELAGKWAAYLDWQRRLLAAIDQHPVRARLYGLENNTRLITDPVAAQYPLFKDGVHYTAVVGDSVLACLNNQQDGCITGLRPQRLEGTSIDAYLTGVTLAMQSYADSHPQEYAALKRWLRE